MLRARRARAFFVAAVALGGCGSESTPATKSKDAGPVSCAPGEMPLETGGCQPGGIPADACGKGFAADGNDGCNAILPSAPCPAGQLAIPGDASCHDVAACAPGKWGDIPVDAATEYVDIAYAGGASDGSATKPWTSVQAAVDAAPAGALIAIAAGSYVGDVVIQDKSVRLWGVCPGAVELVGTGSVSQTVLVGAGADATEVHRLALRGPKVGLVVSGSHAVVADGLWIHDTGSRGINAQTTLGACDLTVDGTLVDGVGEYGIYVSGCEATVASSVVRATRASAGTYSGRGISFQRAGAGPAKGTVRSSVVEQNHVDGIELGGSDATIEATVVRNTLSAGDGSFGRGIQVQPDAAGANRSTLAIKTSLVDSNRDVGIGIVNSDITMDASIVRGTSLGVDGKNAVGMKAEDDIAGLGPASLAVTRSVFETNANAGVVIAQATAAVDSSIVRDTAESTPDTLGIFVGSLDAARRATATFRWCRIERNHQAGIVIAGSDATIEACAIRDTQPDATGVGRGVQIQDSAAGTLRANVALKGSLVERSVDVGVVVGGSDATIEESVVTDTAAQANETFGDGIAITWNDGQGASASIVRTHIASSARAGISNFSSSLTLDTTTSECNAIDLAVEKFQEHPYALDDRGGNVCGCGDATLACAATSVGLEPPAPITSMP